MKVKEAGDEELDLDRLYAQMQSQHQEMVQTMCKHPEIQDGFFYPQWLVVRVVSKRELQHLYLRAIGEQSHVPLLHMLQRELLEDLSMESLRKMRGQVSLVLNI